MNRRGFLGVAMSALAAPVIVRAASIMPVKTVDPAVKVFGLKYASPFTYARYSGYEIIFKHIPSDKLLLARLAS